MGIFLCFSYAVSSGIIDKIAAYHNSIQGALEDESPLTEFVHAGLNFLIAVSKFLAGIRYVLTQRASLQHIRLCQLSL